MQKISYTTLEVAEQPDEVAEQPDEVAEQPNEVEGNQMVKSIMLFRIPLLALMIQTRSQNSNAIVVGF